MIIHKHMAESTEDGTIFNAKIEIETDSLEEYMSALNALRAIGKTVDCDTVCHCNVKVNAEIIAEILDYDIRGEVAPHVPFFPECVEMGVRIIKRKDGVYDIYDETAGKWLQSYASADNVLDWLLKRRLALLGFEEEEPT